MSNEPEQKTVDQPAAAADAAEKTTEKPAAAANPEKKSPVSLEERLLSLNADESKKALHDSRALKRLGIVSYVLTIFLLLWEIYNFIRPHLPGYDDLDKTAQGEIKDWTILLLPLIVILPAYGFALRKWRSNAAKWLFRITSILVIIWSVLDMISCVREENWDVFVIMLGLLLASLRLCIAAFDDILFGANPPSHNQLGYIRSKWKAGEKPDHIPEHVHKLPKYATACFIVAILMIPMSLLLALRSFSKEMVYAKSQEYFEAGQTAFAQALQESNPQQRNEKYIKAYINFSMATTDPKNRDVHVYLGLLAARGLGCAKDEDEAFRQLSKYPETTDFFPDAQYELALLYLYGRGTNRNVKKAADLLEKAVEKGHPGAMEFLGYKMTDMNGENSDENVEAKPDYGGKTLEVYLEEKVRNESLVKTEKAAAESPADAPAQQ